jgi:SAM-dependent methyltransferase
VLTSLPASEYDRRIAALSDDEIWGEYYEPASAARRRRRALLRAAVDARAGERVLDVGCGAGSLAYWAAGRGARVVALDQSAASVAAAARLARRLGAGAPAYAVADALALPVAGGRFDKVVSVDVLDALHRRSHQAFLRELVATARPGGTVLVYTPNGRRERLGRWIRRIRRPRGGPALHADFATPPDLARWLRALDVRARVRYVDVNYPWLARLPLVRGWLAGHMLWTISR